MSDRRPRGRPTKNTCNTSLQYSPSNSLSQNKTKKPIMKTETNFMSQAKRKRSENGEEIKKSASSSTSLASKPLSEYVIPGPIPDNLEDIMKDDSLLVNFFSNIPDIDD